MAENNKQTDQQEDSLDIFVNGVSNENNSISEKDKLEIGAASLEESARFAAILKNREKFADIKLKKLYGCGIIFILILWESFIIYIIYNQMIPCPLCIYHFSDAVLIALLTTATANIVALPTIILKYLFPNK